MVYYRYVLFVALLSILTITASAIFIPQFVGIALDVVIILIEC